MKVKATFQPYSLESSNTDSELFLDSENLHAMLNYTQWISKSKKIHENLS